MGGCGRFKPIAPHSSLEPFGSFPKPPFESTWISIPTFDRTDARVPEAAFLRDLRYAPAVKFIAGFLVASMLWGAGLFLYLGGHLDGLLPPEEPEVVEAEPEIEEEQPEEEATGMRRRRRRRRGRRRGMRSERDDAPQESGRMYSGNSTSGDDLGSLGARELDGAGSGGEEQLTNSEIEAGFDRVFGRVRRCLVLVPDDAPSRGRITFGLRIAPSGRVTRVNLRGPSAITQSEAGGCLRQAARGIRYRSFDGPEMIAHYPLTLE